MYERNVGKFLFVSVHLSSVVRWPWPAGTWSPSHSLTPLPQHDSGGRGVRWQSSWNKMKTGRSLSNYHHGQKRLGVRKIDLIYCQYIWVVRNKDKNLKHLIPNPLSSRLSFIPNFCILPPQAVFAEDGEWGLWTVHNSSSLLPLPPLTFPLFQCGVSTGLRSFKKHTPAAAHRLQCGYLLWYGLSTGCGGIYALLSEAPSSSLLWPWCSQDFLFFPLSLFALLMGYFALP